MITPEEIKTWVDRSFTDDEAAALGLRPATEGGMIYCACVTKAAFAINGVRYQWPKDSVIRWHIGMNKLGALSHGDMVAAHTETCKEIMANCSRLKLEYNPNPKTSNLIWTGRVIDGSGMILAENQLPMGKVTPSTVLNGWFDTGDNWTISQTAVPGKIDWKRTAWHEFLHCLGYGHGQTIKSDPALLEATYSWSLWNMRPRDIAELHARYEAPSTAPPSTPSAGSETYEHIFNYPNLKGKIVLTASAASLGANLDIERGDKHVPLSGVKPWEAKTK